jgi:hypothetical protein
MSCTPEPTRSKKPRRSTIPISPRAIAMRPMPRCFTKRPRSRPSSTPRSASKSCSKAHRTARSFRSASCGVIPIRACKIRKPARPNSSTTTWTGGKLARNPPSIGCWAKNGRWCREHGSSSYGTKTAPWSVNRSGGSGNTRYSAGCTAALRASIETINDTRPSVARNITSAMIELTPSTRLKPPPLCSSEINAIAAPALTNSVK